jgi:protoporphyrinogen/coproporphyrinogen III oxidase
MNSVAIIGAGITGLTAGFRLHRLGVPVTVYESSDHAGGVIRSLRQDGYLAEFGPNTLLDTSPKIREIIREANLTNRLMHSDPKASNRYLVRYRKTIAAPSTPAAFLTSELFSPAAKFKLFLEPFKPRWHNAYEESVAQFVLRRLGQEFLDYAIDALVAGIYAGDPAQLSVIHGFPKLYALEQKYGSMIKGQILGARERKRRAETSKQDAQKLSFDEGLQVLPETLGHQLGNALRLRHSITLARAEGNAWVVSFDSPQGPGERRHSAVLYAGNAYRLADLKIGGVTTPDLKLFSRIDYPAVTSIVLGYRRQDVAHPLDGFGMLIPKIEKFNILGTLFSSSLFPNRAPAGHVTLTSYVGGRRQPDLATKEAAELYRLVDADLRVLLGVTGQPTFRNCIHYQRAIPQYEVGYGQFKAAMDDLEKSAPGFFIAGHFRHGISMSDSLVSGYDVADRINQWLANLKEA